MDIQKFFFFYFKNVFSTTGNNQFVLAHIYSGKSMNLEVTLFACFATKRLIKAIDNTTNANQLSSR